MKLIDKILKELETSTKSKTTLNLFFEKYKFKYTKTQHKRRGITYYSASDKNDNFIEVVYIQSKIFIIYSFNGTKMSLTKHTQDNIGAYNINTRKDYLSIYKQYLQHNTPYNGNLHRDEKKLLSDSFIVNKIFSQAYQSVGIKLDFKNIREIIFAHETSLKSISELSSFEKKVIVRNSLKKTIILDNKTGYQILGYLTTKISLSKSRIYPQIIFKFLNKYARYSFEEGVLFFLKEVLPEIIVLFETGENKEFNLTIYDKSLDLKAPIFDNPKNLSTESYIYKISQFLSREFSDIDDVLYKILSDVNGANEDLDNFPIRQPIIRTFEG